MAPRIASSLAPGVAAALTCTAPLAVDSFGDRISERFLVPACQKLAIERRVGVMAEHASEAMGRRKSCWSGRS
jgi:hypothetical protein